MKYVVKKKKKKKYTCAQDGRAVWGGACAEEMLGDRLPLPHVLCRERARAEGGGPTGGGRRRNPVFPASGMHGGHRLQGPASPL